MTQDTTDTDASFTLTVVERQAFVTLGVKPRDLHRVERVIGEIAASRRVAPSVEAVAHDRLGRLDRSVCGACGDAYVECSKCGVYLCDCSRGSTSCISPHDEGAS